mmetsp:Transcript_23366/g.67344  ORF Transcript_23366/g.67344 Transcript_23366/m.67344 type:complete len:206 (+) Transcript_23366:382-999(+)
MSGLPHRAARPPSRGLGRCLPVRRSGAPRALGKVVEGDVRQRRVRHHREDAPHVRNALHRAADDIDPGAMRWILLPAAGGPVDCHLPPVDVVLLLRAIWRRFDGWSHRKCRPHHIGAAGLRTSDPPVCTLWRGADGTVGRGFHHLRRLCILGGVAGHDCRQARVAAELLWHHAAHSCHNHGSDVPCVGKFQSGPGGKYDGRKERP